MTPSNWGEIPRAYRLVEPETFKAYQFREGAELPAFIKRYWGDPTKRAFVETIYDRYDSVTTLDDGDWVVLDEDEDVHVYPDAAFRTYFEEIP